MLRRLKVGKPLTEHAEQYGAFPKVSVASVPCPRQYVVRPTLMLASNEHSVMFRTKTNGDLCDFLRSSCDFLPHESQEKI